jgi:hypothetical protein
MDLVIVSIEGLTERIVPKSHKYRCQPAVCDDLGRGRRAHNG